MFGDVFLLFDADRRESVSFVHVAKDGLSLLEQCARP